MISAQIRPKSVQSAAKNVGPVHGACSLFTAQHQHRINFRRAPRRKKRGAQTRHRDNAQRCRRDSSAAFIVYTGWYSAAFQSVGLARDTGEVLVSVPAGDTTRIILDPSVDHGNLELVGKCRDDRLAGTWLRTGAPARAWGHFSMRRR